MLSLDPKIEGKILSPSRTVEDDVSRVIGWLESTRLSDAAERPRGSSAISILLSLAALSASLLLAVGVTIATQGHGVGDAVELSTSAPLAYDLDGLI